MGSNGSSTLFEHVQNARAADGMARRRIMFRGLHAFGTCPH